MTRAKWKNRIVALKNRKEYFYSSYTEPRNSLLPLFFSSISFFVYNGKDVVNRTIPANMYMFLKAGDCCVTKRRWVPSHLSRKKKGKKSKGKK